MAIKSKLGPVGRQLEAYGESWRTSDAEVEAWKKDHEAVKKRLWSFEDQLNVGLALFKVIHHSYWNWHGRVQRGMEPFSQEDVQKFRGLLDSWLRTSDEAIKEITALEEIYGQGAVERGRDFLRRYDEARTLLDWLTEGADVPEQPEVKAAGHTERVLNLQQMAANLDKVSRPSTQASEPLKHPPDLDKTF